jgi:hypothetical protein
LNYIHESDCWLDVANGASWLLKAVGVGIERCPSLLEYAMDVEFLITRTTLDFG